VSPQEIGFLGIAVLLVLLALGCPVGIAMILVGFAGFAAIIGITPALNILENGAFETASNYSFTLVPLFLLMGSLVSRAGLSRDLFLAARRFTNGWNGGLAVAGVTASAAFSAVSGSSLATASTMTRVAYPEMRAQGYDPRLAAGSLAAGGTLGISRRHVPGRVPAGAAGLRALCGLRHRDGADLAALGRTRRCRPRPAWPGAAPLPAGGGAVRPGHGRALWRLLHADRGGWRGRRVGAGLRALPWPALARPARRAARDRAGLGHHLRHPSATIFVILIGAEVFGYLLSVSQISFAMADMIRDAGWAPWQLMLAIVVFYLVLGCFMESLAMILLTVPIFYPLVIEAGFDPIWFGVIAVVVVETGLISPPVGMNLFVVRAAADDLALKDVMIGVLPFVVTDIVRLAILIAFPAITLTLPRLLGG
jgi:TRAP-type mannitol/chloroaromatic compound transport system permease large subunit